VLRRAQGRVVEGVVSVGPVTIDQRARQVTVNGAPVRVTFSEGQVLVEDGDGGSGGWQPDLVISGSLPDVAHLAAAPQVAGIPKPTNRRGRAALARVAGGRVRISGNRRLARSLLRLLEI
jgi:hypothetical protein